MDWFYMAMESRLLPSQQLLNSTLHRLQVAVDRESNAVYDKYNSFSESCMHA